MRRALLILIVALFASAASAQNSQTCSCGASPPGPPPTRTMKPYTGAPDDLRPYSKFTEPYFRYYTDLIEYNGTARDVPDPDLKSLDEIRIGLLAPLYDHPDQVLGKRMLDGAQLAIDQANAAGGYCGKPFRLVVHNDYNNWQNSRTATEGASKDSAIWGAASNDAVKMIYDDHVWAIFGSVSSESTHIALRLSLKAETPIVNSASTDPTIPETIIPWYFTVIQDDRVQGYTLARHIYTELGLKRVAILRVNDRYGRFGVLKFRDASRRLGHPVVIEQKFMVRDTDFRNQLRNIQDSRADGIVLWTDIKPTALILQQMQELGMHQRVFGSHRTIGDELVQLAGPAAEGFEAVFPYDPTQSSQPWVDFIARYQAAYHETPDHFASLAYDAMRILLQSICRAGLNRARIRDTLTAIENYRGVTGEMVFDPNCKNISPLFLATVHNGVITYRRITMDKPYAQVGEDGVTYAGPATPNLPSANLNVAVFGPHADQVANSHEIVQQLASSSAARISLIPINSDESWGKASTALVDAVYHDQAVGIIALGRNSSHLAEQIAVKAFVPVICISSDKMLTSTNIPWVFRLPEGTPLSKALKILSDAVQQAGSNRGKLRDYLASGQPIDGAGFRPTGELIPNRP